MFRYVLKQWKLSIKYLIEIKGNVKKVHNRKNA